MYSRGNIILLMTEWNMDGLLNPSMWSEGINNIMFLIDDFDI